MSLVFATGNIDKVKQVELLLADIDLKTPKDIGLLDIEVVEDGDSLKANAYKKAKTFFDLKKIPTIADDTGLFVRALDFRPGIYSHRYAGANATYKDNRNKLLEQLKGIEDRYAYFKTLICYIDENGKANYFEGMLEGEITLKEHGDYDFGYDQIFMPKGLNTTLGEMSKDEINQISHRSKAIKSFVKYYRENL